MTELERAILDAAGGPVPVTEAQVRERFGISPTRHAQLLNALLDRPDALVHAPSTVKRLGRLREQRRSARAN